MMTERNKITANIKDSVPIESIPGLVRRTLVYNSQSMLCHFTVKKGTSMDVHVHEAVQNGFMLHGTLRFRMQDEKSITVCQGDAYLFESNEPHGLIALEDSEFIEIFTPAREEYMQGK